MLPLLILVSTIIANSDAWNLPPSDFLIDFAKFYDRASIVVYLPSNFHGKWVKWHGEEYAKVDGGMIPIGYVSPINDSSLSMVQKSNEDLHLFIIDDSDDLMKNQSIQQFIKAYGLRGKASKEHWLLDVGIWENAKEALGAFEDLAADVDDDLFWYSQKGLTDNSTNANQIKIDVWEMYRKHGGFPLAIVSNGSWSQDSGINMPTDEKWNRRRDLSGVTFRVATLPSIPYITEMNPIPGKNGYYTMEGMFAEVFFALQEIMNFSYTLQKPPDETWGALELNGSWNGMVRMLQMDELDIAATDFTVTLARSAVITFSEPITQIHHRLFIKNPSGTFNYHAYIEPLKSLAWLGIGLYCLLAPPFLFWTSKYGERDPKYFEFTLGKCLVFVISSLTLRGWSDTPTTAASRTAFFTLLVASTLLFWHWEAMLISYLSTRVIVLPFDGIRTLLDNSNFKIGVIPGTSLEDAFKYSTDPDWQEAWKTRVEPYLDEYRVHGSDVTGFLSDSSVALYTNYFSVNAVSEFTTCEIIDIPSKYDFKPYAYGFQKDSPYLGMFNYFLKEMREKGALNQILNKFEADAQFCPDLNGLPLGFDSCITAFLFLIGGMACGFIMVGIEFASKKKGWNWSFLEAYDKRGKECIDNQHCWSEMEQKNCLIATLTLQNKILQSKLEKPQCNCSSTP